MMFDTEKLPRKAWDLPTHFRQKYQRKLSIYPHAICKPRTDIIFTKSVTSGTYTTNEYVQCEALHDRYFPDGVNDPILTILSSPITPKRAERRSLNES